MRNREVFPTYQMLMDAFERETTLVKLLDDFRSHNAMLQSLARQNLLSSNACQIIFDNIIPQGKINTLIDILNELKPLTMKIVDILIEDINYYIRSYEEMKRKRYNCGLRYIFNCLNPDDSEVTRKCLITCQKNGCYPWLTTSLVMMILKNPQNSDEIFSDLVRQRTEKTDDQYISANLTWLRKANLLTRQNVQMALSADKYATALEALHNAGLFEIFRDTLDAEQITTKTCFNAEDSLLIMKYLLRYADGCMKLSTYEECVSNNLDRTQKSYFALHRSIMLKLLFEIMPKDTKYTTERLPEVGGCGSVDEAIHMCLKDVLSERGLLKYA